MEFLHQSNVGHWPGYDAGNASPDSQMRMCIVANKGYYYPPHFVKNIDKETEKDTLLNRFRKNTRC